jgi:polyhydroxyalkanoate synthesis regulator phasin
MQLIKTYANGRFYDTLNKKYISKEQLAALFNKKEEITIVMHKTGDDVTRTVMKRLGPLLKTQKEARLNLDGIKNWIFDQVDRRIEKATALINLPSRDQISRLTADIETLTKRVDELQRHMAKTKRSAKPIQVVLPEETSRKDAKQESSQAVPKESVREDA